MVPDKFNMVDMGDIDLIESQGTSVEGLYQKLVESIALCRYQCLYNWKFNGILIPPSYVEMELRDGEVWINEGVSVDEEDVIHIYSVEPEPPAPVIESLRVTENGTYQAPTGVDGYNPVEVGVNPNIQPLEVSTNGVYTAPQGVDGYSPVTVNTQQGGGIYELINPEYSGLSYCYIATDSRAHSYSSKTNMSNLYDLSAGDYVIFPPNVVGNRFRVLFFAGKTLEDFQQYIDNPGDGYAFLNATANITGITDPNPLTQRWFITLQDSGVLYAMTSSISQSVESVLLKINS